MPKPFQPFRWNEKAGRYTSRGRFVAFGVVRDSIDKTLDNAEQEVRRLTLQLRDRQISLVEWELRMREQVKAITLYSRATAVGGWQQLSPSQLGKVGAEVKAQYGYLNRLGRDIRSGRQLLDGRFLARSGLYAKNGRKVFVAAQTEQMAQRGWDEECNVRALGDSCAGCVEATTVGWVPIGTLALPGTRDCMGNCRCRTRFRNSATGEVSDGLSSKRAAA